MVYRVDISRGKSKNNGRYSEIDLADKDTSSLSISITKYLCTQRGRLRVAQGLTLAPACVQGFFFNSKLQNVSVI